MDKTFHVDMLQEFVRRPAELIPETIDVNTKEGKEQTDEPLQVSAAVVMSASSLALINSFSPAFASMIHEEHDSVDIEDTSGLTKLIMPSLKQKETICDTKTYSKLDPSQITEVENLLEIFSEIFSDVPSKTECITHKIKLSSSDPVRRKPYPLPFTSEQIVRDEISSMIDNDIIEPSDSPYSSPIVFSIVNFYAKFILHISDLLLPLYELTKKDQPERVIWTEQCQRFLEKIQEVISSGPALVIPNVNKMFFVQTDASGTGLGCVLLQEVEGSLRPCRFLSRKLLDRETQYAVVEREALAIVWGVQKLARCLLGSKFTFQTDHATLRCLINGETQNARLCR